MSSRALSLATLVLLTGCVVVGRAWAQATNLEAGKSPSQLFAQTCNACHKSPRGLLKSVPQSSLPGFLRQHYTTSSDMAGVLASYLVSNGAADTRYASPPPKGGRDASSSATQSGAPDRLDRFGRRQQQRPDQEGTAAEAEPRQAPKPRDEQGPTEATNERGPDGRKLPAKQKLGKRSKPEAEEAIKGEAVRQGGALPPTEERSKSETAKTDAGKDEDKAESTKKPAEARPEAANAQPVTSDSAKVEAPETPVLRPDPVPPVTPAPSTPVAATPAEPASANSSLEPASTTAPEPAPAVAASAPPLPSVAPAGPPAPPISQ